MNELYQLCAKGIVFFYDLWPSYAGSITLFTLAIMIVLLPLTLKGTRSMIAMQQLQPEVKKLQNRYKDDRAKLNEEMLKFYKEKKISPLGGCLPLLIQLPVFWVLYEVLLGLTRHGPFGADLGSGMVCGFGNTATNICQGGVYHLAGTFSPDHISQSSSLWHALHSSRQMLSLGIDLSQTPLSALGGGFLHALPFVLMILVVIATTYIQQKQVQGRTSQSSQSAQQQMMMKIMPVAFAVIYVIIPAGVVVYFLVSNLFRIAQQAFITRSMYGPGSGIIPTTATDSSKKGQQPRKGLLSQFVPSSESLPKLGKGQAGGAKRQPAQVGAKANGAKGGGQKGGGAKGGGQKGAGQKGGGQKQKAAQRNGQQSRQQRQKGQKNQQNGQRNRQQNAQKPSQKAPQNGGGRPGGAKAGKASKAGGQKGSAGTPPPDRGDRERDGGSTEAVPARNGAATEAGRRPAADSSSSGVGGDSRRTNRAAPSRRPPTPTRKSPPPPNRARNKKKRK